MATLDERMEAFAISFKDDPDFYRIPFPEHILKKLGLYKPKEDISAMKAVNYAMTAPSINKYNKPLETIDQSETVKTFPNLSELADSIKANETKILEFGDPSSSPEPCVAVSTTPSSAHPASS
jgi:hypothetical protein